MNKARALLRRVAGKYKQKKAKCGCQYSLFDPETNVGMVIQGDAVCSWPKGHATVYQPSRNTVMKGDALQMYKELIKYAKMRMKNG